MSTYKGTSKPVSDICTIIVPASLLNDYRSATGWNLCWQQIVPDNAITEVTTEVTARDDDSGLMIAVGSEEALSYITDLTLSGSINGYDIMIMRNKMPNLHYLDLTNTTIVANPYEYYAGFHSENNRIGNNAFREKDNLREVILPNSITSIGEAVFYHCSYLKKVKLYEGLTTIGRQAFQETLLYDITIPSGVITMGAEAFWSCKELKKVSLPSSLTAIPSNFFRLCNKLEEINFPEQLRSIGEYAFLSCTSLSKISLNTLLRTIDSRAFYNCSGLTELRIPPMVETIGDLAFSGCNNIQEIYVYIANAKDIKIDQNTFSCWNNATLHVPAFASASYYWDTQWSQFAKLEEFSEDYDAFYTKSDMHLDDATGTVTGNPDAMLYEQAGFVVDGVEQDLGDLTLVSDGTKAASVISSGELGSVKAAKVDITIRVTKNKWHFFSFPFDVPLDGITYGGDYVWRRYDGAARSRREGGWQNLAADETVLAKGRGYIFQGTVDGDLVLTVTNPEFSSEDVTTGLFTYESASTQDESWNFVGNPYTAYYNIDATSYDAPITVWTGSGYEAYRPGDDDYEFYPYQAFFVQTPAETDGISFAADACETYTESQQTLAKARALRAKAHTNPNRLLINMELWVPGDTIYTDRTRVVFNDKTALTYETACDAAKFFSEERAAEIFSLDSKGVQYAINERPMEGGEALLGFRANKGGTYTLSAGRMDVHMMLHDHLLGIDHDLAHGGYTFTAEKGIDNQRFSITVADPDITSIDEVMAKTGAVVSLDGAIALTGLADDVPVKAYTTSGILLAEGMGNGTLPVQSGTCVLRIGGLACKVLVK